MLYTREFFEDVKAHLNPGGVVTLFVQLYESNTEAVKSEIGTFFEAFPNGMVFGNTNNGVGYDLVLFGQVEPTKIDLDMIEARLKSPEYAKVAQSLQRDRLSLGGRSVFDLRGQREGPGAVAEGRADQSRSQPPAPVPRGAWVCICIRAGRFTRRCSLSATLPQDLFVGSDALKRAVLAGIEAAGGAGQ